jgi:uncharacterized protein (DUF1015 family)
MYLDGKWYGLATFARDDAARWRGAESRRQYSAGSAARSVLGIKDIRTDKRIDFVGGLRGTKELERLVNEGKAAVAFSLHPTTSTNC